MHQHKFHIIVQAAESALHGILTAGTARADPHVFPGKSEHPARYTSALFGDVHEAVDVLLLQERPGSPDRERHLYLYVLFQMPPPIRVPEPAAAMMTAVL